MRAYQKPGRRPCSVDGCAKPMYARTYCTMHYTRVLGGRPLGPAMPERRPPGSGTITKGYHLLNIKGHPLATSQGKVYAHRVVLYEKLGAGEHPCHWCGVVLPWLGGAGVAINVDHLDCDRLNNEPSNLVPSCLDCNTKRARQLVTA